MKSDESAPPVKSRKGSRTSLDGAKKPRGRPRLEPHDETAADRRRTQIRLAQRAYRQRKETTIVALKQRVSELKTSVDQISHAFVAFSDKAVGYGIQEINADLARELKETSRLISQFVEQANLDQDESFDDPPPKSPKHESDEGNESPASESSVPNPLSKTYRASTSQQLVHPKSKLVDNTNDTSWDSSMTWEPTHPGQAEAGPSASTAIPTSDTITGSGIFDQAIPAWMEPFLGQSTDEESSERSEEERPWPLNLFNQVSPFFSPDLTGQLPLPRSGAVDESTFARRLHRATLERAVQIIQAERLKPRAFTKQFQICLPFCDRGQLKLKIQDMLGRGPNQPMDWGEHPLVHLGGAGLHYQDHNAREAQSSNSAGEVRVRAIGPSTLALLMNATEQDNTMGKALDIAGFEGEWFSPNDVEGYLAAKGIYIAAGSRIQEVVATDEQQLRLSMDMPDQEQRGSPSGRHSLDFMRLGGGGGGGGGSGESGVASGTRASSGDPGKDDSPLSPRSWTTSSSQAREHRQSAREIERNLSARQFVERRTMWVDVDRLVKELVNRATCIGRTPGYRRRDVDAAFTKSVAAH